MPDTFNDLRPRIVDYLYDRGIDPQKRFRCLNPKHLDRDPSMGYDAKRQKVHCFACGADYDLFDLLAIDENLTSPHDALALASKRYGHGDAGEARPADRLNRETLPASYPESCFSHRRKTDYFAKRGLSDVTVTRFRLGYDPEHDCVVLPCENGRCVRRGDTVAAGMALAEFVKSAISMVYLLNRWYMPYYKWAFHGLKERAEDSAMVLPGMVTLLEQLSKTGDQSRAWEEPHPAGWNPYVNTEDQKVVLIEAICGMVIEELKRQGLTEGNEDFLEAQPGRSWIGFRTFSCGGAM